MKLPHTVVALLASLLFLAAINLADAQWDALNSGYAVTTNYHGKDVSIGMPVTATAGTNDSVVKTVEFRWMFPNGSVYVNPRIPVFGPYVTPIVPGNITLTPEITSWTSDPRNAGIPVWYAQNTQIPNAIGDWGVQAIFHDTGKVRGKNSDRIACRATSFNVVPEVPFGTVVILLSWIGLLGVLAIRKKHLIA